MRWRLVWLWGLVPFFWLETDELVPVAGGHVDVCPLCLNGRLFSPDEMRV